MERIEENLGLLIEKMVRRKGIPIVKFAEQINCCRNNVYDIFKRNSIDMEMLTRISLALEHNFFEDAAKRYEMIISVEGERTKTSRRKSWLQCA